MTEPSNSSSKIARIARYEILRELGRGGMAVVYLASDPNFQREVAVKVLPREAMHDSALYQRFQREARAIASLDHPAIVPVYDFGEENSRPFLVMRYLSGGSLAARIKAGPLPVAEAAKVLLRIGGALDAAHAKGIVHRDLKPANILFDQHGDAYLSDFGIAQLSESTSPLTGSAILGTPAYMSPEQIRGGGKIDGRADIYALGIVLFEMLTGRTPFKADTPAQVMMMHLANPTPRLPEERSDLPDTLNGVLIRALAKDPELRIQKASELGNLLSQIASGKTPALTETSSTFAYPQETAATRRDIADAGIPKPSAAKRGGGKPSKRWPVIAAIAAALLCICAVGGSIGAYAVYQNKDQWFGGAVPTGTPAATQAASVPTEPAAKTGIATIDPATPEPAEDTPTATKESSAGMILDTLDILEAIAWSPDGSMLATAGNGDGSIRIWGKADGGQVARLEGHQAAVIALSWSLDGKFLASHDKEKKVIVWDTVSWTQTADFFVHNGMDYMRRNVQWAMDSKHLGLNTLDGIQYLDYKNPNTYDLFTVPVSLYSSFTFAPNGKEIAGLSMRNTEYFIHIWNLSTRQLTSSMKSVERSIPNVIAWSPDGKNIAVASTVSDASLQKIHPQVWFWRVDSKTRLNPAKEHSFQGLINDMTWAPDSSQAASGGEDGIVLLWSPVTGEPWYSFSSDNLGLEWMISIRSLAWSPDGLTLAIAYQQGKILFWNAPPIAV